MGTYYSPPPCFCSVSTYIFWDIDEIAPTARKIFSGLCEISPIRLVLLTEIDSRCTHELPVVVSENFLQPNSCGGKFAVFTKNCSSLFVPRSLKTTWIGLNLNVNVVSDHTHTASVFLSVLPILSLCVTRLWTILDFTQPCRLPRSL